MIANAQIGAPFFRFEAQLGLKCKIKHPTPNGTICVAVKENVSQNFFIINNEE